MSTHAAAEWSQRESNDRTVIKLGKDVVIDVLAYLTGISHEFVEQLISFCNHCHFFRRVESRNGFNKELIMSFHPGKKC
jgi:hypothetical protein